MKKLTSFILSALLCVSMLAALPQAFCCDGSGTASAGVGVMNLKEPKEPEPRPSAAPDKEGEPEAPFSLTRRVTKMMTKQNSISAQIRSLNTA